MNLSYLHTACRWGCLYLLGNGRPEFADEYRRARESLASLKRTWTYLCLEWPTAAADGLEMAESVERYLESL